MLKLVNPEFSESWIEEFFVARAAYGQAVCHTDFADLRPEHRTPIRGLYVTDSTQFYPEDRTLSAAIEQGRKAAALCLEDGRVVGLIVVPCPVCRGTEFRKRFRSTIDDPQDADPQDLHAIARAGRPSRDCPLHRLRPAHDESTGDDDATLAHVYAALHEDRATTREEGVASTVRARSIWLVEAATIRAEGRGCSTSAAPTGNLCALS